MNKIQKGIIGNLYLYLYYILYLYIYIIFHLQKAAAAAAAADDEKITERIMSSCLRNPTEVLCLCNQ